MTVILKNHIVREKSRKTVCVTACLTHLGIPFDAFRVTSTSRNIHAWEGVVRRNGFAMRSRLSSVGKNPTVGNIRTKLSKLEDPQGTRYLVRVRGYLLMLDINGKTIVDTAPRKRDARRVLRVWAVYPK